jgi:hypothetical protein
MLTTSTGTLEVIMRKHQRSRLSLVTFCAVTLLIAALGSAVLLAGASMAFAVARPVAVENVNNDPVLLPESVQPPAAPPIDSEGNAARTTFSGMITDSRCGARHRRNSGKTSAECARACVRNGARYVLVDGEKIYALAGDSTQLEKLAGERVNLSGTLKDDTITVTGVTSESSQ